jgi:hypothetical protein
MVKKTPVIVDGEILSMEWIMHQGKAWLVPYWLLSPDDKLMRPVRIISLAVAHGHNMDLGELPLAYFQSNPIPKCLIDDGVVPPELEKVFEILEEPGIWIPNPEFYH